MAVATESIEFVQDLTVDVGSAITQAVLEPVIHKGIEGNWLISLSTSF